MYYERLVDSTIERKLRSSGAVLVAGPKFCGKTTTCMRFQKSFVKLNTKQAIALAKLDPRGALTGEKPRLIDEWQTVPDIWNQIPVTWARFSRRRQLPATHKRLSPETHS